MKKIRVFDSPDDLPRERSSLLAVSNKYGLTFVGQGRALKVFVTDDIIAAGKVSGNPNEIGKIFIIKKYEMIVRTIFFFSVWNVLPKTRVWKNGSANSQSDYSFPDPVGCGQKSVQSISAALWLLGGASEAVSSCWLVVCVMCDTQLSVHLAFSWSFVGVSKSKRAASGTRFDLLRVFCLSALKPIFSNSNDALSLDGNLGFAYVTVSSCSAVEGVTCQTLTLDLPMHHLALSSDELTLSVCGAGQETVLTLDFYDVRTFFNKVFFFNIVIIFYSFLL